MVRLLGTDKVLTESIKLYNDVVLKIKTVFCCNLYYILLLYIIVLAIRACILESGLAYSN